MKDHSELLSIFMFFLSEIINQIGKIIKILLSDNAKEYFSSNLSQLFKHEILHQSSLAKLYSKKEKIDTVETIRTLLFDANMHVHYSGDSILTIYFLINKIPFGNKDPYSILFAKEPLSHISPSIFNYVSFVHDMSSGV